MTKIVINVDYGGFGLSEEAMRLVLERKGLPYVEEKGTVTFFRNPEKKEEIYWEGDFARDDKVLVEIVEALTPEKASGRFAFLKVVEIPDDVNWYVQEYDGKEWIAERHRTWG